VISAFLAPYDRACAALDRAAPALLPTLARLVFAGVLLVYFWSSARTKLGEGVPGLFHPSVGGYAQIFPRAMEAVQFDVSKLTLFHWAVVEAGIVAEFLLPLLVVLGLMTRLAALGMTGFVLVQTATDIWGHGVDAATVGRWFDRASGAVIADQRAFWILGLATLVLLGAGPLSLDRMLRTARAER
jgi:putative oxidoreductase